ncbi:hypothetical protein [Aquimarina pacifica]|uniref:hypothetical protein n=1 Tax=Aquimarina pacifica TaxID=1296415 RepID=UPI00046EF5D8|nr:hypothetical protein [Aquimarina pacifica]
MNLSNDFLTLLIKIGVGLEVITAIIGTIYYNKYKNVPVLKYFIFLLWYVVFNELIGLYIRLYGSGYNALIINVYNLINFSYILYLFQSYLSSKKSKKIVLILCVTYLISFIINGFYENYLIEFQSVPYIIAAFFVVITILLYFREILNSEKVLYTKKNLLFWIGVGLLLYFIGNIPFRIIRNYYEYLSDATTLFLVNFTLAIIMNACFIIGFIWSDKKQLY